MNRLVSCHFGPDPYGFWPRMARVLSYTAALHCSSWERRIDEITAPPGRVDVGIPGHLQNSHKLAWWNARVQEARDGDQVLLIDTDAMILRPLDDVWQAPFDIAYTVRTGFPVPFNGGVIFLRISRETKAFVASWLAENTQLMMPGPKPWRRSYGGVNQASFAVVLPKAYDAGLKVRQLPCREWNCEDSAWASFDPEVTRILHIKSNLRRAVFYPPDRSTELHALRDRWHQAEALATARARTA